MRHQSWRNALVELVLIITGVLVALGVDDWNTERSARGTEAYYLAQIQTDLSESKRLLSGLVDRLTAADSAGVQVYPFLRDGASVSVTPQQLVVRLFQATRSGADYSMMYVDDVYESLRSTGDLRLIRDPETRRRLVRFYALGRTNGFLLSTHPTEYNDLIRGPIPSSVQTEIREACPVVDQRLECEVDMTGFDAARFLATMRGNAEAAQALNLLLVRLAQSIPELSTAIDDASELLDLLEIPDN